MTSIVHIAVPCPLRQAFDYLADESVTFWQTGQRVEITFRNKPCIGIVLAASAVSAETDISKLKHIEKCLDQHSLIPQELFDLILWVSRYYHHPIGECFQTALPKLLRQGQADTLATENWYQLTTADLSQKLGSKQQQCVDLLADYEEGLSQSALREYLGNVSAPLKSLQQKHVVTMSEKPRLPVAAIELARPCELNAEQQHAVDTIWQQQHCFTPFLLEGVTGSGKTEVYIQLTEKMLAEGKQVLILIPEIGLTGQFVERFRTRIQGTIAILNSAVSDTERKQAWLLARNNLAQVIIGTRSAVFTPLAKPSLIIIDEEHDGSFKQQDGLKYHARNVALIRAQKLDIPIIMGSATPSLESLYQAQLQRYQLIQLTQRAGGANLPKVQLVDTSQQQNDHGLSQYLLEAIQKHIDNGNQVILFINRRGFAPVLMCHECGWQATCTHCDARMVVHQHRNILFCHHCGFIVKLVEQCPQCEATELKRYGAGTEKIEQSLQQYFPQTPVLRIDRDTTQRVNAFAELVAEINQGEPRILVGTQMLAKGHDFHDVTLVGVLDADQGLYSADFRAMETLAQLVTQVTGRAGRGDKKGEVLIQTDQPQHDFWKQLIRHGYRSAAEDLLAQRQQMQMPPVCSWAVIRAESKERELAQQFLQEVLQLMQTTTQQVILLGPVPAIMERKGGRYRAQLLLMSEQRKFLHQLLDQTLPAVAKLKLARKLRWSVDIDPVDLI